MKNYKQIKTTIMVGSTTHILTVNIFNEIQSSIMPIHHQLGIIEGFLALVSFSELIEKMFMR
jgi:hypothetical protein